MSVIFFRPQLFNPSYQLCRPYMRLPPRWAIPQGWVSVCRRFCSSVVDFRSGRSSSDWTPNRAPWPVRYLKERKEQLNHVMSWKRRITAVVGRLHSQNISSNAELWILSSLLARESCWTNSRYTCDFRWRLYDVAMMSKMSSATRWCLFMPQYLNKVVKTWISSWWLVPITLNHYISSVIVGLAQCLAF